VGIWQVANSPRQLTLSPTCVTLAKHNIL